MKIKLSVLRQIIRETIIRSQLMIETVQPKLEGILKLNPDASVLLQLQSKVLEKFPDMKPVPEAKLHITLLHQSKTKPLKGKELSPYSGPLGFADVYLVERENKRSVFAAVDDATQQALSEYMGNLGVDVDAKRTFHVSLANMTGSPGDSVGHTDADPIMNGAQKVSL